MPQDPLSNNQAEIRSKTKLSKDHPKIDDYLRSFPSAPDAASRKRKREKFTTEGARKVRSVRNKGACVACHYRKTPCSVDEICAHCLKAVKNDYSLAKEICVRNKMQDSYFGVKTIAIFGSLEARKGALDPLLQSLSGNSYPVELSVKSSIGSSDTAVLPLRVRQCDLGRTCRWKGLSKVKGIYITSKSIYAPRYAVIPGCVSFANVEKFSCQVLSLSLSHSGGITRFLDDFMSTYSHYSRSTELREFVRSSRSVVGLNGLVSYGSLEIRDGSYELLNLPPTDIPFVGPTVHDQIRLLAAGGLEIAEKTVFSQIDSFKKLVGPNKHARIVGGICLLRLLLLYRDRVLRDAIRVSLPREKILHRERLEQSSFMYRRLTVAYGILCRDANTPITTSWVAESDSVKWTKEDNILQTQFSRLQDAYKDFCKLSVQLARNHANLPKGDTLTDEHDDLFKGVVVNSRP
ncbi:hypothetical protein BJ875DRAFT_378057 [Amylocarpus encephaloides]|uniref:Uncharacterized protein n=1 Tax=Amylocarpus encephaloides TaxID=45428 RepID=A0A9P7YHI4_9HELO|nr:hypothetical protein BJ875DRAFT_378057 [Amylocarpus encephaloides]